MAKTKRKTCSLAELCRRAGVDRNDANKLFSMLVEVAVGGEAVNIPHLGKFWAKELKPRRFVIPVGREGVTRSIRSDKSMSLRFTPSQGFRQYLRIRARGRARGTE